MDAIQIVSLKTTHKREKEKTPSGNSVSCGMTEARIEALCHGCTDRVPHLMSDCNMKSVSRKVKKRSLFLANVIIYKNA